MSWTSPPGAWGAADPLFLLLIALGLEAVEDLGVARLVRKDQSAAPVGDADKRAPPVGRIGPSRDQPLGLQPAENPADGRAA